MAGATFSSSSSAFFAMSVNVLWRRRGLPLLKCFFLAPASLAVQGDIMLSVGETMEGLLERFGRECGGEGQVPVLKGRAGRVRRAGWIVKADEQSTRPLDPMTSTFASLLLVSARERIIQLQTRVHFHPPLRPIEPPTPRCQSRNTLTWTPSSSAATPSVQPRARDPSRWLRES